MEGTWHCGIPDVTVPKKPDFKWLEEDLGEALTDLFCNKTPDTSEAVGPPAAPPIEHGTATRGKEPREYRGVYYILAGYSMSQFSDRGSKLSKFMVEKKFTDH